MLDECLPADPRVLTGYTQTLMAQLCLDSGLPGEYACYHLEKTRSSQSLPAWLRFRRGVLYREAGEPELSLRVLNSLSKTEIEEAELHYQKALCWMDLSQWMRAAEEASLATDCYQDEAFVELLGEALVEMGEVDEALDLYDTVLEGLQLYSGRIYVYERIGKLELAIKEVDQALSQFPDESNLLSKRAQLKADLGDLEGARWDYSVAIALKREPEYLASRALLYVESGEYRKAARDAELAVSLEPNDASALKSLATVLDAQGKLDASAVFWGRYIKVSNDLQGLLLQAEVLNRAGKLEESDQLLQRYRQFRPECWEGKYYQMAFWRTRGMHEEAEALAQEALSSNPNEFSLLFERAENFLAWERYEQAAELCLDLRKRFPEALEVREFWIEVLAESSRYQLALEAVDQLLSEKLASKNDAMYLKANILAKLNRWKESLQILNALVESEPDNADYYEDRAQAFFELNQVEESWQDASKGLDLDPSRTWLRIHRACMNVRRGELSQTAEEAALVLKEDIKYQHRLFCRALWLGAKVGERLKNTFSPLFSALSRKDLSSGGG